MWAVQDRAVLMIMERMENGMISGYKFGKIEDMNCFEDETNDSLYFPVADSTDFPKEIRDKTEKMINSLIYDYEVKNNCKLFLSRLCLNARMITCLDNKGDWRYEISVVITGNEAGNNLWVEDSYEISAEDHLYELFKMYFMKQVEKILFG